MSDLLMFAVTDQGHLAPADPLAQERMAKLGRGELVLAAIRQPRNPGHHRKFFAMVKLAFEYWKPQAKTLAGAVAAKSFDRFRKDLVIAAGHYDVVLGMDGEAHLEAESLRFDAMDQGKFEEVYTAVFNVLSQGILQGMTKQQAMALADRVWNEGF